MLRTRVLVALTAGLTFTGLGLVEAAPAARAAAPLFVISPTTLAFGDQPLNSPSPEQTVTITNVSGGPQTMAGAGGGAGVFGGSQDCENETLAPGDSCHMYYQFTPDALGRVTGSTNGSWNGQDFDLTFTGTGTPQFLISPTGLDFGQVAIGSSSPEEQVDVTNVGTSSATMSGSGGGAGVFGGSQDCEAQIIAAGNSCHMDYTFSPTALGVADGSTSGAWNNQPFALSFTGVGTGPASDDFVALPEAQLLGGRNGHIAGKHTRTVTVAGVPSGATAADLTIATSSTRSGRLTVWDCSGGAPSAPSLLFHRGVTSVTHVNAPLNGGTSVCVEPTTDADVTVGVDGYYPSTTSYQPQSDPVTILDTKHGVGRRGHRPLAAGKVAEFAVTGSGTGVQPDTTAAAIDLEASGAHRAGHLTVWSCTGTPKAAALSFPKNTATSVLTVVPVGAGGTICVRPSATTQVTAILDGTYASLAYLHPVNSRPVHSATASAGKNTTVPITGAGKAPADAGAVLVEVTASGAKRNGRVSLFPCGSEAPSVGELSLSRTQATTNLGITTLGTGGTICLRPSRRALLTVDLLGWYAGS